MLGVAGAKAAAIVGVPVLLFLRHGRWSRVSAKDGHVRDSLSSRLSVSKASDMYFFRLIVRVFVLVGLALETV